jgi:hypothetical protein
MAPLRASLLLLSLAPMVLADEAARPRHNSVYVRDDVAAVTSLVAEATKAAEAEDAATAADRIEALLLTDEKGLVPVRAGLLYVSPRRWAQIQLLSGVAPFGDQVLKAWRDVHDAEANAALKGAILAGDEAEVLLLVERYPAATGTAGALLALSDRALQRGDPDEALGYLLRVREHLATSEEALLASDGYRRRADVLRKLGPRRPPGWPTPGGDPSRGRNGDPLPPPERLKLLWQGEILPGPPPSLVARESDRSADVSPLLPFPPVCDAEHVYVHLGPAVAAFSRQSGKLVFYAPEGAGDEDASDDGRDRIDELLARSPGGRAATVADGVLYFDRALFDMEEGPEPLPKAENELVAFDVRTRATLWTKRLKGEGTKAPLPIFFRGAPAVVGDRLYVYGAVRDRSDDVPTPKEEAHLFCLDRRTGKVIWRRFLGYGDTDVAAQFPPDSGLPVAVAKGVVVAVTGLGVAAALDARSGDLLWLFRYDRRPSRERERLAEMGHAQMVRLRSGWMREPPRIEGDSVYFAPFDAEELFACWLRGARTPVGFEIEQWAKDRAKGHRHSLLEYFPGIRGDRIWCVGRRDPRPVLTVSYQAVVSWPLDRAVGFAYGLIPHTEEDEESGLPVPPEIYGNPTIAGDVLLVPTRKAIYRFDTGREPAAALKDGERLAEIPALPPYLAPPELIEADEAAFGALLAVDGFLYVATTHRLYCYGEEK